MSCTRGCSGTPLCSALNLCCLQFLQDCGKECAGVAEGYSTIQVNAAGELVICSNIGGVCECSSPATDTDVLVDNGDGTATHTAVDATVVTLDICQMIENGGCVDQIFVAGSVIAHTSVDGTVAQWDVCDLIPNNCPDSLVDNGDGTFTFIAVNNVPAPVIVDVCQMVNDGGCSDALLDNGDGTFTHTALDAVPVIIDICQMIVDGNCFLNITGGVSLGGNVLPGVIPPATPNTLLDGPATYTMNNTSTSPMNCSVNVGSSQLNIQNTGGAALDDVGLLVEYTLDGGATWIGLAHSDVSAIMDAPGTAASFLELTTGATTLNVTIPAGGSETFGIRRFYNSPTGATVVGLVDAMVISSQCSAMPV